MRLASAACALALAACATTNVGPTATELKNTINAATGGQFHQLQLRSCRGFDEEPTELVCTFIGQESAGEWRKGSAIVTYQSGAWMLLHLE